MGEPSPTSPSAWGSRSSLAMATAAKPWSRRPIRRSMSPSGPVATGSSAVMPPPATRSSRAKRSRPRRAQSHSLSFEAMAPIAQRARGTQDLLPADQPYWDAMEDAAAEQAAQFGFQRIETPVFEATELFKRGAGESSDIVIKEMYTFTDRGNRSLTLRPEGTAPIVREVNDRLPDRKSTRLNSSHDQISYAVFCLKK